MGFERRWDSEQDVSIQIRDDGSGPVKELANRIPSEIKRAIDGINGDIQYAIVVLLAEENGLPFSELQAALDIHQQTLSNALGDMQNASLISKHERELSDKYAADYTLTQFGERLFVKLFESLGDGDGELVVEDHYQQAENISGAFVSTFRAVERHSNARSSRRVDMVSDTDAVSIINA